MTRPSFAWIGLAGADEQDGPRAMLWQDRLHWIMVGIALLAVPGYLLDTTQNPALAQLAMPIDVVIFAAFLAETAWMVHLSRHPGHYLAGNWLNLLILAASLASLMGAVTSLITLVRTLRVAMVGLVLTRTVGPFGVLLTRRGAPLLVGIAVLFMLGAGGMFYWLEPTVRTFWDGLWLAFVTGSTLGYGDLVPTTGASRAMAAVTALVGVSLIALFTANIVSVFVDRDEKQLRRDMHHDIVDLRNKIGRLLEAEDVELRASLASDMQDMKRQLATLVGDEQSALRRERSVELAELKAEIAQLRAELVPRGDPAVPPRGP